MRVSREPANQPPRRRRLPRRRVPRPRDVHGASLSPPDGVPLARDSRDTYLPAINCRPHGPQAIDTTTASATATMTTVYRDATLADANATGATRLGGPREG